VVAGAIGRSAPQETHAFTPEFTLERFAAAATTTPAQGGFVVLKDVVGGHEEDWRADLMCVCVQSVSKFRKIVYMSFAPH